MWIIFWFMARGRGLFVSFMFSVISKSFICLVLSPPLISWTWSFHSCLLFTVTEPPLIYIYFLDTLLRNTWHVFSIVHVQDTEPFVVKCCWSLTSETVIMSDPQHLQPPVEGWGPQQSYVCPTHSITTLIRNHRHSDESLQYDGSGSPPASQQAGNQVCSHSHTSATGQRAGR